VLTNNASFTQFGKRVVYQIFKLLSSVHQDEGLLILEEFLSFSENSKQRKQLAFKQGAVEIVSTIFKERVEVYKKAKKSEEEVDVADLEN
jgi:hypothetical protein